MTHQDTILVKNINIIRPEMDAGENMLKATSLLVDGGRVASIGPAISETDADMVIDGTGKWLLPGYVDTHVHFFQSANPYTRPDAIDLTGRVPYELENARNHARLAVTLRTWLASGVTSVMDMGGPFWNFTLRDIAAGMGDAPRVQVTGPLFSMVADKPLELDDPPIIRISSLDDVRTLAERQLPFKPDYLKVWFIHAPDDDLAGQEKLVREVGRLAHQAGLRLAVHATELETAKSALRCGADMLVHSVSDEPVDNEFLQLAAGRHAVYMPTLYVPRGYPEVFSRNWKPTSQEKKLSDPEVLAHMQDIEKMGEADIPERNLPMFRRKGADFPQELHSRWQTAEQNLVRVWNSGITVTLATDAGNIGTMHGPSIFREMSLMEHAGLSPAQILRCATVNGAKALGLEAKLGRVAVGYLADLVILNSSPLDDIGNASDISHIIREGRVYSQE